MASRLRVWRERLFGQWSQEDVEPPPTARELGFEGPASGVILSDEWRREALAAAEGGRARLDAARDYFCKVQVNASRLAAEYDDHEALQQIDDICEEAAEQLLVAMSKIQDAMAARGYEPDRRPNQRVTLRQAWQDPEYTRNDQGRDWQLI